MRFSFPIVGLFVFAVALMVVKGKLPFGQSHGAPEASPATALHSPGSPIRIIAEGRLATYPGADVTLSSELPAVILRLPVQEKDAVRKGELIAELKADDLKAQGEEAQALITETEANLRLLDIQVERTAKLWELRQGSKQDWDRNQWQREALRALHKARIANAHRLLVILAKMQIVSPIDGVVIARNVDPGEMIASGTPIVTIANLSKTRIEAEVDEFDAGRIHLGDKVAITSDGYPGMAWHGAVEEIPDVVVGRRLKPLDPARPVDTRVLMVKIALNETTPLKLGQRVDLEIFISGQI